MEVPSTPGPSAPPSPSTSTSTEHQALCKIETSYVSKCDDAAPVTAPRYLSGWRAYLMIGAISGSTFLNVYSNGAMTVAIPSIGNDLNFTQADLAWPLQAYNLTYGCLLLLTGRLADKYGRRTVFLIGAALFSLLSVPPIFTKETISFNIMTALLGISAAMMTSAGMGILGGNLRGTLKNRAIAVLAAGQSVGFIFGLLSAGFLCSLEHGWRYIFVLQAALGMIFVVMAAVSVPKDTVKYDRELDWLGVLLSTGGLVLFIFTLSHSQNVGWRVAYIPTLFSLSIFLLVMFVQWEIRQEKRGKSVLLAVSIFRQPRVGAFFALVFLVWWSFNVQQYFITLYFQDVQKLSPMETSMRFIPESLSGMFVNTLSGWLVEYVSSSWLGGFGVVATVASGAIFATIDPTVSYWQNAFFALILMPAADTIFIVGNLFTISFMDAKSQALAGGLFSTVTRISTAVGLAVTSAITTTVTVNKSRDSLPSLDTLLEGYQVAGWICFATALIGIPLNFYSLRGLGVIGGMSGMSEVENGKKNTNTDGERGTSGVEIGATKKKSAEVKA